MICSFDVQINNIKFNSVAFLEILHDNFYRYDFEHFRRHRNPKRIRVIIRI